jgi:hypothetical protein
VAQTLLQQPGLGTVCFTGKTGHGVRIQLSRMTYRSR